MAKKVPFRITKNVSILGTEPGPLGILTTRPNGTTVMGKEISKFYAIH